MSSWRSPVHGTNVSSQTGLNFADRTGTGTHALNFFDHGLESETELVGITNVCSLSVSFTRFLKCIIIVFEIELFPMGTALTTFTRAALSPALSPVWLGECLFGWVSTWTGDRPGTMWYDSVHLQTTVTAFCF